MAPEIRSTLAVETPEGLEDGMYDRLAVIAHWIAYAPTAGPSGARAIREAEVPVYQRCGWTVEGPLVPSSQLRGAIEERDELREALEFLAADFEAYAGQDAAESGYYRQVKRLLGGQCRSDDDTRT